VLDVTQTAFRLLLSLSLSHLQAPHGTEVLLAGKCSVLKKSYCDAPPDYVHLLKLPELQQTEIYQKQNKKEFKVVYFYNSTYARSYGPLD
jgi:hypothetical protein